MIAIDLDGGAALAPGERAAGRIRGDGHGELVVSLLWYTAGRGTEDVTIVAQERVAVDGAIEVPFAFDLPEQPWSFSGTLISLRWALEASVEPGSDVVRVDLVCAPGGREVVL